MVTSGVMNEPILSLHLADVGARAAAAALRAAPDPRLVPGLRHAVVTTTAPLSPSLLPRPALGRIGLIAAWDGDEAVERFLAREELGRRFAGGWHARMLCTRVVGAWPALDGLLRREAETEHEGGPVAALTLGHLRLRRAGAFLRASARTQALALRQPGLLAGTGLARPPHLVATFTLWKGERAMRDYVEGDLGSAHLDAVRAHAARPFHHESAFIRLRPYASAGLWDGADPLAAAVPVAAGA
jgi:hypothetical protein